MTATATLTVIKPIVITDAMLTSHTEAESESVYDAGTSYSIGDAVIYGADHDLFSSLVDTNLGNTPIKWPNNTSYWYDEGKTNRWNMFDLNTNIQTTGASPMVVVLEPGEPITAIHFDTIECDSITVSISDGVTEVYNTTIEAKTRDVYGWYTFFTEQHRYIRILSLYDLPGLVALPVITITFTNASGDAKCGGIIVGRHYVIGTALSNGSSHARKGFSVFERDEIDANRVRLLKRGSVKNPRVKVFVSSNGIDRVMSVLDDVDGLAASWTVNQDTTDNWYGAFALRGVYRSPVNISTAEDTTSAYLEIELEGI